MTYPPNEVTGSRKDKPSGLSVTLFNKSTEDNFFVIDNNEGKEAKTCKSTIGISNKINTDCILRCVQRSGDDYYIMKGKGSFKVT